MPASTATAVSIGTVTAGMQTRPVPVELPSYNREFMEDVGFLTCMTHVLMCNYAQTGHFGGTTAYTPYNVCLHLAGGDNGGLRYDIRNPKHPYADKFMLAGGHNIPSAYALWIVLYESMAKQHQATRDAKYLCDPNTAMLAIDTLGFRRSHGALANLLKENGLENNPLFAQAKQRGIRSLAGHSETTDVTNDVNGGPSGVGITTAPGKAVFWDSIAGKEGPRIMAIEGEFALTSGHSQEMKTIALSNQVGKRMRLLFSLNNAGIDDTLFGGVIKDKYKDVYNISNQWVSYGWNVMTLQNGHDYDQIMAALRHMEAGDPNDRRPMVVIGNTIKGYWPAARDGKVGSMPQVVSYESHPYAFKMNGDYFVALCSTFEQKYGVEFSGIRNGAPATEADRLVQLKTNIDIALSILDKKPGFREWICQRLLDNAAQVPQTLPLRIDPVKNPFKDERLKVENLPAGKIDAVMKHPTTGQDVKKGIQLFLEPGQKMGTRRALSEIGKYLNYITGNRLWTVAADLSHSINIEGATFTGHYDVETNPAGTRLKAGIQEAGNSLTCAGLASQNASKDPKEFVGMWAMCGTYGAFTPLMYLPLRIFSQQNQDSPFEQGVVTVVAGHSGPETAADARSHFGIFAPQVWTLFPRGQVINLYFWDYNDVASGYFAAVQEAIRRKETGLIVIHVARPDVAVVDRKLFADTDVRAAAKGAYVIREHDKSKPAQGTIIVQGASATTNLVKLLPRINEKGPNVRIVSVISEELFDWQPKAYRDQVLPDSARFDCMVVTTMTKRILPISNLGPLVEEYTLSSDFDNRWRTGGSEDDIIKEAKLDPESIYAGITRFAKDRPQRLERQRKAMQSL